MGIAIIVLISICFGVLHYYIAVKKGLNGQGWFVIGFLLGPFSLPVIMLRKRRDPEE